MQEMIMTAGQTAMESGKEVNNTSSVELTKTGKEKNKSNGLQDINF